MEKDHFSSGDEAGEADSEGDAEPREDDNASAAEASVGTNAGWADAMWEDADGSFNREGLELIPAPVAPSERRASCGPLPAWR